MSLCSSQHKKARGQRTNRERERWCHSAVLTKK